MGIVCNFAVAFAALAMLGCGSQGESNGDSNGDKASRAPIRVLVTISTFDSFVRAVAGDRATVDSLVPVGASPEDYQPAPTDIEKVHDADLLVENGLGLEAWLDRTIMRAIPNSASWSVPTACRCATTIRTSGWIRNSPGRTYGRFVMH